MGSPNLMRRTPAVKCQDTDASSIYSSPSMLSIHSTLEVATSHHEDDEVQYVTVDDLTIQVQRSMDIYR